MTYENERISLKDSLPYLKCVLRLSCVVQGPIYGRFMGFYVNGFISLYQLGKPSYRNSWEVVKKKESLQILDLERLVSLTGDGVLTMMAYTGRLRPKGVPFSGFRYIKG